MKVTTSATFLIVFLSLILILFACKKDPAASEGRGIKIVTGPGEITDETNIDVDQDGQNDVLVKVGQGPHSAAWAQIKCLHDQIGVETQILNDTIFIHHASVIPDHQVKERIIQRMFLCARKSPGDSVQSVIPDAPHLIYRDSPNEIQLSSSFQKVDLFLCDIVTPPSQYYTTTEGDSVFRYVQYFAGDCRDNLPEDRFLYIGFIKKGNQRRGYIKIKLKDSGHKVIVPEIAITK